MSPVVAAYVRRHVRCALVAGAVVLVACSSQPRWIAVADGGSASLFLFRADLSGVDTVRFHHPDPGQAYELHVSEGGGAALVGLKGPRDALLRIRLGDGAIVDQWPTGRHPLPQRWHYWEDPRLVVGTAVDSMDGNRVGYVSLARPDLNWEVRRLDVCGGAPTGLAPFHGGNRLYVSCDGPEGSIVEVDPVRLRVVRTSSQGLQACSPTRIAFSRNEGILFALCRGTGWLLYLDRVSLLPIDSVQIGPGIGDLLVLPRAPEALLLADDRNELTILNLRDHTVRSRVAVPGTPRRGTVIARGRVAYVTTVSDGGGEGYLVKVDLVRAKVEGSVSIPPGGPALAAWPGPRSPRMDWR